MVNNQKEFNEKYPKEVKEIEIRRNRSFQGELVIEGYLELENLILRDIRSINKITLKNLPQLQVCTIWDCGLKELVIENCPQIKTLNVRRNSLTSLDFLNGLSLSNLEKLEVEHNPEISKILEPHNGDWRRWVLNEVRKLKRYKKKAYYDIQSQIKESSELLTTEVKDIPKEESELKTQIEQAPDFKH